MALSKTLIALGNWIEKRFPEKLTASEVNADIANIKNSVGILLAREQGQSEINKTVMARLTALEAKTDTLNSDVNKTKVMLITQRQTAGR